MKTKRFAALVATGLLAVQMFGVGVARAGSSACDFGSDDLEVTIDSDDVAIAIDDGYVDCDDSYNGTFAMTDYISLAALDSITVEMDDEDTSEGEFFILLEDVADANEPGVWQQFANFDIDVTTPVTIDASTMTGTTPGVRVTVGAKSVSFEGTTATSNAPSYTIKGSDGRDLIDGSKATVKLVIDGNGNNDNLKGGSVRDDIDGGNGSDVIYGGAGNDILDGEDTSDFDQCWGQDGDDYMTGCTTVAPGAGNDEVSSQGEDDSNDGFYSQAVTYADLKAGLTFEQYDCEGDVSTGGAAGDDIFDDAVQRIYGSPFDDVLLTACGMSWTIVDGGAGDDRIGMYESTYGADPDEYLGKAGAYGGPGDDFLSEFNYDGTLDTGQTQFFIGGPGNDRIRAGNGYDRLVGGKGRDTLLGGGGVDTCASGEILNSCDRVVTRG